MSHKVGCFHHSDETKKKISKTLKKVRPIYLQEHPELKIQISNKLKGHPCYKNIERNKKISIANKKRIYKPVSEETKRKISIALKGNPKLKALMTIERRQKMRELMLGRYKGEKNPAWLGGLSLIDYGEDWNEELRQYIRDRDNRCMLCNISLENAKKIKLRMPVHHIDYIKTNNYKENLVLLCIRCHLLTNLNRDEWRKMFVNILTKEYGYLYDNNLKPIIELVNHA